MGIIFLRTVFIYLLLVAVMRLMGKRQIGELEVSELITTLMLSELATGPIAQPEMPVLHAVAPILTLLGLEVAGSYLLIKLPGLRGLLSARPSVLIAHGKLDPRELERVRMSLDELIGALRQQGATGVDEVDYAILEANGRLTVIPRVADRPPTTAELGLRLPETGIAHILVADGRIDRRGLARSGHDEAWLTRTLRERDCTVEEAFLFTLDDGGGMYLCKKPKQ